MRINDKSLSKFASSGAPPDKEGFLLKKGEINKGFQKRWFVLKGNLLFYYEKRGDKDPLGMIVLEGSTIELSEHVDGYAFQINFPGSGTRTYILAADTQEEMEAWMKILSCSSYDYMKLMVAELQQQLEDLNVDSQQRLCRDAVRDSRLFSRSYSNDSFDLTIPDLKGTQRINPFNSSISELPESTHEDQCNNSLDSPKYDHFADNSQKKKKNGMSFLELHEKYRRQVLCLSELWRSNFTRRDSEVC